MSNVASVVRILVGAGATHASAARAALILEEGGSISDARDELVLADSAAEFDPLRLLEGAKA